MSQRRSVRPGFTLVELLVVIAIIGLLVAMLMAGVQHVREAARRIDCQSRLKQIGLAIHNYSESHGTFPPAYVNASDTAGWGWGAMLLPALEQTPLYNALQISTANFDGIATANTQIPLQVFICPSDTGPNVNSMRGDHAKSNFAGVFGSEEIEEWDQVGNGVFHVNSSVRLADINDGTSNTFAVGERRYNYPAGRQRGAIWVGKYDESAFASNLWSCVNAPPHKINGDKEWAFSSMHSGGAYFLFCDGHVQFVKETIDGPTYENLANKGDGNVTGGY